jgi:hypothetical protein
MNVKLLTYFPLHLSVSTSRSLSGLSSQSSLDAPQAFSLAFEASYQLAPVLDASHALTSGSPPWALSIGIGTAFAGTNPVSPNSPLRILKKAFHGGAGRGSGRGRIGGGKKTPTATSCP